MSEPIVKDLISFNKLKSTARFMLSLNLVCLFLRKDLLNNVAIILHLHLSFWIRRISDICVWQWMAHRGSWQGFLRDFSFSQGATSTPTYSQVICLNNDVPDNSELSSGSNRPKYLYSINYFDSFKNVSKLNLLFRRNGSVCARSINVIYGAGPSGIQANNPLS